MSSLASSDYSRPSFSRHARQFRPGPKYVKRVKNRRLGASTSQSAGFIKSQFKSRRKNTQKLFETKGVRMVYEMGGVIDGGVQTSTAGNTVAVGHCTLPFGRIMLMFWRGMVKHLYMKNSWSIDNFLEAVPSFTVGDQVSLYYYSDPDSPSLLGLTKTVVAGDTFDDIANFFYLNMTQLTQYWDFKYWSYAPTATSKFREIKLDLDRAMVHFRSKSSLKFQNRTINTEGGDEESVDNVPLYGKSYYGNGNGTGAKGRGGTYAIASRDFVAEDTSGVIAKVPVERWFQEPPGPEVLTKVKKYGKVHLDPGQIKTSNLFTTLSISIAKFWHTIAHVPQSNIHHMHWLGKYRFLVVEKMLTSVAGNATNSIKVAYEHNLDLSCYVTTKVNNVTLPITQVGNLANEQ